VGFSFAGDFWTRPAPTLLSPPAPHSLVWHGPSRRGALAMAGCSCGRIARRSSSQALLVGRLGVRRVVGWVWSGCPGSPGKPLPRDGGAPGGAEPNRPKRKPELPMGSLRLTRKGPNHLPLLTAARAQVVAVWPPSFAGGPARPPGRGTSPEDTDVHPACVGRGTRSVCNSLVNSPGDRQIPTYTPQAVRRAGAE